MTEPDSSDEQVVCAVCDTEWGAQDLDECPECGSKKVWDMEAAFKESGVDANSKIKLYELLGIIGIGVVLSGSILQVFPQFAPHLTVIGGTVTILAALKGINVDRGESDASS